MINMKNRLKIALISILILGGLTAVEWIFPKVPFVRFGCLIGAYFLGKYERDINDR